MKRRIKWLLDWFVDWVEKFYWEEIVGFSISVLIGITLTIMLFTFIDKVPANQSDYEQLEEQINVIQRNPDTLLETNCNININEEVITVELENDECKMIAKYNKDFEILSTSKEDKSMFWLWALVFSLMIGVVVCYIGKLLLPLIILLLKITVELIFEIIEKLKKQILE